MPHTLDPVITAPMLNATVTATLTRAQYAIEAFYAFRERRLHPGAAGAIMTYQPLHGQIQDLTDMARQWTRKGTDLSRRQRRQLAIPIQRRIRAFQQRASLASEPDHDAISRFPSQEEVLLALHTHVMISAASSKLVHQMATAKTRNPRLSATLQHHFRGVAVTFADPELDQDINIALPDARDFFADPLFPLPDRYMEVMAPILAHADTDIRYTDLRVAANDR